MKRRDFAKITGIGIGSLLIPVAVNHIPVRHGDDSGFPDRSERKRLACMAINAAIGAGAVYAEVRIGAHFEQNIFTHNSKLQHVFNDTAQGISVRAIAGNSWGFAFQETTDPELIAGTAERAVADARLQINGSAVVPHSEPGWHEWSTPLAIDPFSLRNSEKTDLLLEANSFALQRGVADIGSSLRSIKRLKFFASSQGTFIDQTFAEILPFFSLSLAADRSGQKAARQSLATTAGMGLEYLNCSFYSFKDDLVSAIEDAREMQRAQQAIPGKCDLILDPHHLAHVIRNTIAADFRSGLLTNPVGSESVSFFSDRNQKFSPAAAAFDDHGLRPERKQIITKGLLPARRIEVPGSGYADNWRASPGPALVDLSLSPGHRDVSLDNMINGVESGYYIKGFACGEFDIDNKTFSAEGQVAFRVENGRIAGQVKNLRYHADLDTFWKSCVQVCGSPDYRVCGFLNEGGGHDGNTGPVTHGSAPARFNNISFS